MQIEAGIPDGISYDTVVASPLFAHLETCSNDFLAAHPVVQASYGWVRDPLHQWSRQIEYPFVYQQVAAEVRQHGDGGVSILDAGSGATFFPFLLADEFGRAGVTCCDYDPSLQAIFDTVNAARGTNVGFRRADLRDLPFDDASFDIVYCVSVLEHTDRYEEIVSEFERVLRPGGLLVATFDIGLDGVSDIPPAAAEALHRHIAGRFAEAAPPAGNLSVDADAITSAGIGRQRPELLPWRFPLLSWVKAVLRRRHWPARIGKNLTVLCAHYRKRS